MSIPGAKVNRARAYRGAGGYSMVEMIVAIGMAVIVSAGLYAVLNSQRRSSSKQKTVADLQTSCSYAMDQIKQDLLLAGYRAEETNNSDPTDAKSFSLATASEVAFEFFDDKAKFNDADDTTSQFDPNVPYDSTQYSSHTNVHYVRDATTGDLVRLVKRWRGNVYAGEISQIIAPRIVSGLQFTYENAAGVATTTLDDIRKVGITLTCRATTADSVSGLQPSVTLTAAVQPRNMGLQANPKDETPPNPPTHLRVFDPGVCGNPGLCDNPAAGCATLQLRWTGNTEADLAGYNILYGLAPGSYSHRIRINRAPKSAGDPDEQYELTGLSTTKFPYTAHVVYYIVIQAFDKNSNYSGLSTPVVYGNKVGTDSIRFVTDLGADETNNDSTPDVAPAAAPTFTAAAAPAGWDADPPDPTQWNKIVLTWTASATPGVIGYRLYRSETENFTPQNPDPTAMPTPIAGNLVANETVLGADVLTYTDTVPKACSPYFYKIAAINCDNAIPITGTTPLNFSAISGQAGDRQGPPAPTITAASGWKRLVLSLTNPVRGGSDTDPMYAPDFDHTVIFWNTGNYPTIDANGVVSPSDHEIPRSSPTGQPRGTFTGEGTLPTISFNHLSDAANDVPSLEVGMTYYFLAVAYDQCGNRSDYSSSAITMGTQCGDCLKADGTPDPICYEATGLAVGDFHSAGCTSHIDLSWAPIETDIRDFVGFRVSRREGTTWTSGNPGTEVDLTGADPQWGTSFVDATANPGVAYTYRVMAVDCYYEEWKDDPDNAPLNQIIPGIIDVPNSPLDNYADYFFNGQNFLGAYVGLMDDYYSALIMTTGDLSEPDPTFRHNVATPYLWNYAAGPQTLQQVTARWEAPAYLRKIVVGPGSAGTVETTAFDETTTPHTKSSGSSVAFTTPAPIHGMEFQLPMRMTFSESDGTIAATTNLRDQVLGLDLKWKNDSTGDTTCARNGISIQVPLGPLVSGVTMSQPTAGTLAVAYPGASGTNPMGSVVVPGGQEVDVFAQVYSTGMFLGFRNVWLFYYADPVLTNPSRAVTGTYDSFTGGLTNYTPIQMISEGGDQYRTLTPIPAFENQNVWFFIVAEDLWGGFDREPETEAGAFNYYQQPLMTCDNVPRQPGVIKTEPSAGTVHFELTAPATNVDNTPCVDFQAYRVYRRAGSTGGFSFLRDVVPTAADRSASFDDTPPGIDTTDYYYQITAIDVCTPTPRESAPSTTFMECHGVSAQCSISLSASASPFIAGGTIRPSVTVCTKQNGISNEQLWIQDCSRDAVDADALWLREVEDSGTFRIDSVRYGTNAVTTYLPDDYPTTTSDLNLKTNASDRLTFQGFLDTYNASTLSSWDSSCMTSGMQCTQALDVVPDPCSPPATPSTPQSLAAAMTGNSCTANGNNVQLTWTPSTTGPVSSYRVYRCNGENCEPTAAYADVPLTSCTGSSCTWTDTTPGGKLNSVILWYTVKAENASCPTAVESAAATKVNDTCSPF